MSIQQGLLNGYVNTEIRDHKYQGGEQRRCHFWLAGSTGKDSKTVVIMDAND